MSTEESASDSAPAEHPLMEKLMTGGDNPNLITLRGYVRRPVGQDLVTLYPSLDDLSLSIDIAPADIVHFTEPAQSDLPRAGTTVWVKRDAMVTARSAVQVRAGDLQARLRRQAASGAGAEEGATSPGMVRAGRLVIQKRATPAATSGCLICTSQCELCGSFCNCQTFCFTVPQ